MPAYIYSKPFVSIGGTDLVCMAEMVELIPTDIMGDASTFCYPDLELPSGLVSWTFKVRWKQDYAASGVWDTLTGLAATGFAANPPATTAIILRPNTAVVGATNPQAAFSIVLPTPHFMSAGIGQSMTWEMEAKTVGEPVFTVA